MTIFLLIIAMISIQLGSAIAKTIFATIGPLATVSLRVTIAAVIMLLVFRPWRVKIPSSAVRPLLGYGICLGLMNCAFYLALDRIPLGICVALEFTGPLAVAILASKRKIDLLWVVFAAIGIVLVSPINMSSNDLDILGVLLALVAGVGWGLYIVFGKLVVLHMKEHAAATWGMVIAALVTWPVALPFVDASLIDTKIIVQGFFVAILASAIPYTLEMFALKRLSATTFGILMSLEPALAGIAGVLVLHEVLNPVQWIAIASIVLASAGCALTSAKDQSQNHT